MFFNFFGLFLGGEGVGLEGLFKFGLFSIVYGHGIVTSGQGEYTIESCVIGIRYGREFIATFGGYGSRRGTFFGIGQLGGVFTYLFGIVGLCGEGIGVGTIAGFRRQASY